jgi:hypothetical protein
VSRPADELARRRARVARLATKRPDVTAGGGADPLAGVSLVRRTPVGDRRRQIIRLLSTLLDSPDAPEDGRSS